MPLKQPTARQIAGMFAGWLALVALTSWLSPWVLVTPFLVMAAYAARAARRWHRGRRPPLASTAPTGFTDAELAEDFRTGPPPDLATFVALMRNAGAGDLEDVVGPDDHQPGGSL